MGHKKSKATDKSNATAKTESTTVAPKGAGSCQRTNAKIVQSVLLIWLDTKIDEDNNDDCRNTITQLQCVVNNVNTFTNGDQCIEFLSTIDSKNYRACMIISGSLGQQIVARVHKMSQVDSIFIFCSNKKYHEQWTKEWTKIKGAFTEITPICEALKKVAQQCEHNATPISFMATDGDNTNQKKLDQLDCSFMYTQILRDILLTITFEQTHIQEFIEYCREQFADIEVQSVNVNKLEKEYHKKTPVWWYTCDSFLYSMLNSALPHVNIFRVKTRLKCVCFACETRRMERVSSETFHASGRGSFQNAFGCVQYKRVQPRGMFHWRRGSKSNNRVWTQF